MSSAKQTLAVGVQSKLRTSGDSSLRRTRITRYAVKIIAVSH